MNNLQIFNFEEKEVRTVVINNEPYFIGKDVAEVLGYLEPHKALDRHVDEDDRMKHPITDDLGRLQKTWIINESGLYGLILSSKLSNAKKFKRWVTSEVLPSIRKTGGYQVPTNPMQALELMFQAQKETNDKVVLIENDVQDLKENKLLPSSQYEYIRKLICKRVYCIKEIHNIAKAKPLYKAINYDLNRFIGVKTRTQFKEKHFDKAIKFIEEWTPSYTDLELIKLTESF